MAAALLKRLGVDSEDIGGALDGRVERFRSAVAGKRLLIVLDHAVTAAQVTPFVTSAADILVTAQSISGVLRMDGACFHDLTPLEEPFASELFYTLAGLNGPDAATDAIVGEIVHRFCGRLPLLIKVCGVRFAGRAGHQGLSEWFDDFRGSGRPPLQAGGEGRVLWDGVFDEMYEGLDQREAQVFRAVGVLPSNRFTAGHVAAMLLTPIDAVADTLVRLAGKQIVLKASGFFEIHGLVQRYGRDVADAYSQDEADKMRCRVVNFMTACAQAMDKALVHKRLRVAAIEGLPEIAEFSQDGAADGWFDAEHGAVLGYMRLAKECGLWRQLYAMSEAWWSPAYARHEFDFALALSDRGIEVAELKEDPAVSSRLLGQSALVCIATGDLDAASDRLARGYRWLAAVKPKAVRLKLAASLLEWSGKLADAKGADDEAEKAFAESRDFFVALGDRRGIAIQDYHLAKLAFKQGKFCAGADLASQAIGRLDRADDSLTVARFSVLRARCLIGSQDLESARTARTEMAELCELSALSEAWLLLGRMQECIATAAEMIGDRVGQRAALASAHEAFTRSGSRRVYGVAQQLAVIDGAED
ncbi:hypothetical protein [Mycobacteroides abscessus]|uniref:hypothetical protein n=1 Tax=Mycobacteroides abscessus TaxID=36809 RepID=UPI0012FFF31E|nr:hypothetical protein [Mycobacteroides abscessus]